MSEIAEMQLFKSDPFLEYNKLRFRNIDKPPIVEYSGGRKSDPRTRQCASAFIDNWDKPGDDLLLHAQCNVLINLNDYQSFIAKNHLYRKYIYESVKQSSSSPSTIRSVQKIKKSDLDLTSGSPFIGQQHTNMETIPEIFEEMNQKAATLTSSEKALEAHYRLPKNFLCPESSNLSDQFLKHVRSNTVTDFGGRQHLLIDLPTISDQLRGYYLKKHSKTCDSYLEQTEEQNRLYYEYMVDVDQNFQHNMTSTPTRDDESLKKMSRVVHRVCSIFKHVLND